MTQQPELTTLVEKIRQRTQEQHDDIIKFMREICALPSMNSLIGPVGEHIQAKMRAFGFDEVRFDKMGNTLGRIGDGPKVIVYDSHIDTVGIGDRAEWEWDPFEGKVENAARDIKGIQPSLQNKRALIVDDNATNRRILKLQTEKWGMTSRDTEFPREAIEWIQRRTLRPCHHRYAHARTRRSHVHARDPQTTG